MLIRTRWLALWAGRDIMRRMPASFGFLLLPNWRAAESNPGMLVPARLSLEASWEWSPVLCRMFGTPRFGEIDSAAWTGRPFEIRGFRWSSWACLGVGARRFSWRGFKERWW